MTTLPESHAASNNLELIKVILPELAIKKSKPPKGEAVELAEPPAKQRARQDPPKSMLHREAAPAPNRPEPVEAPGAQHHSMHRLLVMLMGATKWRALQVPDCPQRAKLQSPRSLLPLQGSQAWELTVTSEVFHMPPKGEGLGLGETPEGHGTDLPTKELQEPSGTLPTDRTLSPPNEAEPAVAPETMLHQFSPSNQAYCHVPNDSGSLINVLQCLHLGMARYRKQFSCEETLTANWQPSSSYQKANEVKLNNIQRAVQELVWGES